MDINVLEDRAASVFRVDEAARSSGTLVSLATTLYGAANQKTSNSMLTVVKTSKIPHQQ
jgi:hypothetical protein